MEHVFRQGDVVKALQDVEFVFGEPHKTDQLLLVTEESVAYYNLFHHFYQFMLNVHDVRKDENISSVSTVA